MIHSTVIMNHTVVMSRTVVVTAADSCCYQCHFVVMTHTVVMNYSRPGHDSLECDDGCDE